MKAMWLQWLLHPCFLSTTLPYKLHVFWIYEPGFCTVVLTPPLRQLLMCLTRYNTATPHGCLKLSHLSPLPPLLPLCEILPPPNEGSRPSSSQPSAPCELSDSLHDAHPWGKHMFTISMIPCNWLLEVITLTGGTQTYRPSWTRETSKIWALFLILLLRENSDTICLK